MDQNSIDHIIHQLHTVDVIKLQGVCENTISIVKEIKILTTKEIQRRGIEANLKAVRKRGEIKKTKKIHLTLITVVVIKQYPLSKQGVWKQIIKVLVSFT